MSQTKNIFQFFSSFLSSVKVEERKGAVTPRLEIYLSNGRYILDSARVNYSFGGLHAVFRKAFSRFNIRERDISNALILGFGTGSVASILCDEYKKDVHLTGVEKDPVVIDLAKKYFHIDRYKNLSIHIEDAGDFVENCEKKFDLVVVDIFVGADVPEKFGEEKFLAGLGRLLSPGGISFFNVVVYDEKVRTGCASLFEKMNSLIGKTEFCRVFFKGTENWIFVCDKRCPVDLNPAAKENKKKPKTREAWPSRPRYKTNRIRSFVAFLYPLFFTSGIPALLYQVNGEEDFHFRFA